MKSLLFTFPIFVIACGDPARPAVMPDAAEPACSRGKLESDMQSPAPLAGPAVDPATGTLKPPPAGGYFMSTTYIPFKPEPAAAAKFQEVLGPVTVALRTQPGIQAIQVSLSSSCGAARTFTVWQDEAAMFAFVGGVAHSNASAAASEISRGGGAVTSWLATSLDQTTWEYAAGKLAVTPSDF
jgi:heme-degrading monooxygenase HmoA